MDNVCPCCGKEAFGLFNALLGIQPRRMRGGIVRRKPLDLLDVEDGIAFEERNIPLDFLAVLVRLGLGEGAGIADKRTLLALAHMRPQLPLLLELHPDGGRDWTSAVSGKSVSGVVDPGG